MSVTNQTVGTIIVFVVAALLAATINNISRGKVTPSPLREDIAALLFVAPPLVAGMVLGVIEFLLLYHRLAEWSALFLVGIALASIIVSGLAAIAWFSLVSLVTTPMQEAVVRWHSGHRILMQGTSRLSLIGQSFLWVLEAGAALVVCYLGVGSFMALVR